MSEYLTFFELENSPFDTSAKNSLVLGTKALRSAFAQIEKGLAEGSPRICVGGKAGMGKTSLSRALPKLLGQTARVVLIMNPSLPWDTLRAAMVRQLELEGGILSRKSLLQAAAGGQRLVLAIDQAERISKESLEHLDILLGYLDDDDQQILHCVLLANLDQATQEEACPLLWWLDSLTTLQLEFSAIPPSGITSYIEKHLKRAGWKGGALFSPEAGRAIHRLTGGVPRDVSGLCESALEEAAQRGMRQVDEDLVLEICGEKPAAKPVADETSQSSDETPSQEKTAKSELDGFIPKPTKSNISLDSFFQSSPQVSQPAELTLTELADPEMAPGHESEEETPRRWRRIFAIAATVFGALLVAGGGYIATREKAADELALAKPSGSERVEVQPISEFADWLEEVPGADANPSPLTSPSDGASDVQSDEALAALEMGPHPLPDELRLTRTLDGVDEGPSAPASLGSATDAAFDVARADTPSDERHPSEVEDGNRYWLGE